jgi:hypothetical protein
MYASSEHSSDVYVYTFPGGKLVGDLAIYAWGYSCVDDNGDVFFPGQTGISEYRHGGSQAVNFLALPNAFGCSVDHVSGNLAVTTDADAVYIYADAQGSPAEFIDSDMDYFTDVAYDGSGNLFLNGAYRGGPNALLEMPSRSSNFEDINVSGLSISMNEPLLWDGKYLAVGSLGKPHHSRHQHTVANRLEISGGSATIVQRVALAQEARATFPQFWIHNGIVAEASDINDAPNIEYFAYPGGRLRKQFKVNGINNVFGLAISVVPAQPRIRK